MLIEIAVREYLVEIEVRNYYQKAIRSYFVKNSVVTMQAQK